MQQNYNPSEQPYQSGGVLEPSDQWSERNYITS